MGEVTNMNRAVIKNSAQGDFPRVLAICSAGVLRSPTIAWVLSNAPFNFNTRSAGISDDFALIKIDAALIQWAEFGIVCAEHWMLEEVDKMCRFSGIDRDIFALNIPDNFDFREPRLVRMIERSCRELFLSGEVA